MATQKKGLKSGGRSSLLQPKTYSNVSISQPVIRHLVTLPFFLPLFFSLDACCFTRPDGLLHILYSFKSSTFTKSE